MDAQIDLGTLLAALDPELVPGDYVFCRLRTPGELPPGVAFATIAEDEGTTAIVRRADAERAGLERSAPFRRITLQVRSSLTAIGLTAAVATALARRGIPANVVAAFHHDHVFVPAEQAGEAIDALRALADDVPERGGEAVGVE
ncbi:MAG TPA: ACT domain-containing protein [Candidatus Elarobacter sp.]|jgi:hypothetical protein